MATNAKYCQVIDCISTTVVLTFTKYQTQFKFLIGPVVFDIRQDIEKVAAVCGENPL